MNKKTWIVGFGSVLSVVLLAVILYGLDWTVFRRTLMSLSGPIILAVCAVIAVNFAVRAVRWLLIGDAPWRAFSSYWQAVIIGHLGNLIYPLRAGELMRVVALGHFTGSPLGQVVTSAFIDRLSDVIMLGFLLLVVGAIHGEAVLGQDVISLILVVVIVGLLVILLLLDYSPRLYAVATSRDGGTGFGGRARLFLTHLFVGFMKLRGGRRLVLIAAISVAVFCLECFARFGLMKAFGWDLPFEAAMTLVGFLYVGVAVPSAPGYVGVYQAACVLALHLYGVPKTDAFAYSIVSQLLDALLIGTQGILVTVRRGFIFTEARREAEQSSIQASHPE